MKLLFITAIFVLAVNYSKCQTQYEAKIYDPDLSEIGTAQQAGYALIGLGALTIIYTAAKTEPVKNPTPWYIGGGTLIAGGLCLLIFGKKDPEPKYWKGMQGYSPKKNLRNDFLTPVFEFSQPALQYR
ncbi:MAG: hypothetical protein ACHQNT_09750 [Bacteroidia bacterium]